MRDVLADFDAAKAEARSRSRSRRLVIDTLDRIIVVVDAACINRLMRLGVAPEAAASIVSEVKALAMPGPPRRFRAAVRACMSGVRSS